MNAACIVPAYEAEATVGEVVRGLLRDWPPELGPARVIVVDDGSRDETSARADAAGAKVVRHLANRGKGAALVTGLDAAHAQGAEVAVSVDADGQHPPREALRLALDPAPPDALVLGVRDLIAAGAPRANQISNGISNAFLSWFTHRKLADTQCGLRRYPIARTLALSLKSEGYALEAEVVMRAAHAGWPIAQVPVVVIYPPEHERITHFQVARDPARIVLRVLATQFSRSRR